MKIGILKKVIQPFFLLLLIVFIISGCSKTNDKLSEKPPVNKDSTGITNMNNVDSASMENKNTAGGEFSKDMNEEIKESVKDVREMKSSSDFNKDYADMLIRLNEAAVDIAETEKNNGMNENMKNIASTMVDNHKKAVSKLENWKDNYKEKTGSAGTTASLMKVVQSIETNINSFRQSNNIDKDFGELMKLNHQASIDLGQAYMKDSSDKDLKDFTKHMLEDFPKEVKELETAIAKVK